MVNVPSSKLGQCMIWSECVRTARKRKCNTNKMVQYRKFYICPVSSFDQYLLFRLNGISVTRLIKRWPIDLTTPGSILVGDGNLFKRRRGFIAHSLSL